MPLTALQEINSIVELHFCTGFSITEDYIYAKSFF